MATSEFAEQIQQALTETSFEEFLNGVAGPKLRQVRDHIALAHRYCCAAVQKYHAPPGNPNIMEELAQLDNRESQISANGNHEGR